MPLFTLKRGGVLWGFIFFYFLVIYYQGITILKSIFNFGFTGKKTDESFRPIGNFFYRIHLLVAVLQDISAYAVDTSFRNSS